MDILPRVVDMRESNGEITKGVYAEQLTAVIGEGAYNAENHRNKQFMGATTVGPYPEVMQEAWGVMRRGAATNYGIEESVDDEEKKGRLGPLAESAPAGVRNRGAAERKEGKRTYPARETMGQRRTTSPKQRAYV